MLPQFELLKRLQKNVNHNRDRIRGQLKGRLFQLQKHSVDENEISTPLQSGLPSGDTSMDMKDSPSKKGLTLFMDDGQDFSDCYDVGKILGQGAHAIVKVAKKKNDPKNETVAVKIFRTSDPEIITTIRKTYQIGRMLNHPNIVKVRELFINENNGYSHLVMDYLPLPDLQSQLPLFVGNETLTRELVKQLLSTIGYMHKYGVCHRDIKPDNILIQLEKKEQLTLTKAMVIDMGVSKKFVVVRPGGKKPKFVEMWTSTGTQFYQAPEIVAGGGYSQKVDVWAVGVIMFQCLTGCLPFQDETVSDTIDLITKATIDYNHPRCQKLNKLERDLINRLLQPNPKLRLNALIAMQHPWFKNNNLIKEESKTSTIKCQDDSVVKFTRECESSQLFTDLTQSQTTDKELQRKLSGYVRVVSVEHSKPDIHVTKQEPRKDSFRLKLERMSQQQIQ